MRAQKIRPTAAHAALHEHAHADSLGRRREEEVGGEGATVPSRSTFVWRGAELKGRGEDLGGEERSLECSGAGLEGWESAKKCEKELGGKERCWCGEELGSRLAVWAV